MDSKSNRISNLDVPHLPDQALLKQALQLATTCPDSVRLHELMDEIERRGLPINLSNLPVKEQE